MKFTTVCMNYPQPSYIPKKVDYFFWPNVMMKEKGFDSTILTWRLPGTKKEENVDGIRVKRFTNVASLLLTLRVQNPELVHSHTFGWMPGVLSSAFCKRSVFAPNVYTLETSKQFLKTRIFFTKMFNRIITLTEFERQNIIGHGFDPKRVTVITDAIDYNFMSHPYGGEKVRKKYGENIVISIANYGPRKNLDTLIKSIALVRKKVKDVKLLIIGRDAHGGYKPVLKETARKAGVEKNVYFLDWLKHGDVINYLDAADVFALPSKIEGQCIAACEAAAAGVPLVLSNIGPLYELYRDFALFSKPDDLNKLAKNITDALTDEKLRKTLIKKGKIEIKKYDISKVQKRQYKLYTEVLQE